MLPRGVKYDVNYLKGLRKASLHKKIYQVPSLDIFKSHLYGRRMSISKLDCIEKENTDSLVLLDNKTICNSNIR